jgi:phenylacetic acid degradation operon negative regulatory protein
MPPTLTGRNPARKTARPRPEVSRRREIGGGSARSLLMTILGEYVLPAGEPVWTSTLVGVLGMLGVEEKSARQALARSAAEGWLSSERVGRRVRWQLTPPGRRLLVEGAKRIYGFGSGQGAWDGKWLVILVSLPESTRDLRHKLRTRLSWAGFGAPAPGVWIAPQIESETDAKLVLDELKLSHQAISFIASCGAVGNEQEMVAAAWNLGEIAERYEQFIDDFSGLNPRTPDAVLLSQARLVHEWRRFPFLDPQLPADLLPPRWSGTTATALFNDLHGKWRDPAQQRWQEIASHAALGGDWPGLEA